MSPTRPPARAVWGGCGVGYGEVHLPAIVLETQLCFLSGSDSWPTDWSSYSWSFHSLQALTDPPSIRPSVLRKLTNTSTFLFQFRGWATGFISREENSRLGTEDQAWPCLVHRGGRGRRHAVKSALHNGSLSLRGLHRSSR